MQVYFWILMVIGESVQLPHDQPAPFRGTVPFDHMGRMITVTDAVGDIDYAYNSLGLLVSVTDSLAQVTTNTYDTAFRLTKVTDDIGKETHYTYDSAGRQSAVGAGTSGTVDVTTYTYSTTTGRLTSVQYGSSTYTANYVYDGEARLVKLTDWIDAVDGLRYDYDAVGRLVEITDYDDSTLTYTYDDAGTVLTMEDYHGNTTTYTYNDIGQLATLTAPGSKVWTYTYDTGNRLTKVDIPNGMHTEYAYDTAGRMDSIHHKEQIRDSHLLLTTPRTGAIRSPMPGLARIVVAGQPHHITERGNNPPSADLWPHGFPLHPSLSHSVVRQRRGRGQSRIGVPPVWTAGTAILLPFTRLYSAQPVHQPVPNAQVPPLAGALPLVHARRGPLWQRDAQRGAEPRPRADGAEALAIPVVQRHRARRGRNDYTVCWTSSAGARRAATKSDGARCWSR